MKLRGHVSNSWRDRSTLRCHPRQVHGSRVLGRCWSVGFRKRGHDTAKARSCSHHGSVNDHASPSPSPKRRGNKGPEALDPEALRARLEEAIDFPGTIREALQDARAAGAEAVAANQESLKRLDELYARVIDTIEKELVKPDLTPADRDKLIDKVIDVVARRDAKDTENKNFLAALTQDRLKAALVFAGVVSVVAVAAVAGPDGLKQIGKLLPQAARRAITP